jgi:hypothetical protein
MPNIIITHVTYDRSPEFHTSQPHINMPAMPITPSPTPGPSEKSTMTTSQALKAAKKELRTLMKAKLSQILESALESQSTSRLLSPPANPSNI